VDAAALPAPDPEAGAGAPLLGAHPTPEGDPGTGPPLVGSRSTAEGGATVPAGRVAAADAALPVAAMVAAATRRVVGRSGAVEVVAAALAAGRSILLEGPPGTGKTTLLRALSEGAGIPLVVVEGNAELSPGRLVGSHDPSRLLAEGYRPDNFVPGPLVEAMTGGALLYVEELNRVPEETLNVLLGVLSERSLQVPRYGQVRAAPTFRLVAAMNPYDAVGTGRISPALYDRTCRVALGYQSAAEETAIVARGAPGPRDLVAAAVRATRATRSHPDLRVGASVRGALDLVAVALALGEVRSGSGFAADPSAWQDAGADAALAALSGRVTRRDGGGRTVEEVIAEIWAEAVSAGGGEEPGKAGGPDRPRAGAGPEQPSR
jgi:MoxR-like ATPase